METLKHILENKKCLKLICGAGNENIKEIEKLVYVYAMAGFNFFDICAKKDVLIAAENGLKRADSQANICVSIGLQNDVHVSKAVINNQKCINCNICLSVCPQNAIYIEDNKCSVDEKKCIGCFKCLDVCQNSAIITEHKYKAPHTMLLPLISEKIDSVEFHCTSDKTNEIIDNWYKIRSLYKGLLSICLDRSKLGDDYIIYMLKEMLKKSEPYSVILQVDGKPMSGGENNYNSTLQTVAFAKLINDAKLPVYILLSGGTNSLSTKLAKECEVNVNGVAIGSYARKIVKDYIQYDNFFENDLLKKKAIAVAKELAQDLLKYL